VQYHDHVLVATNRVDWRMIHVLIVDNDSSWAFASASSAAFVVHYQG
jgi:hypothetical protein